MKRLLSFVLALLVTLTIIPLNVLAVNDININDIDGALNIDTNSLTSIESSIEDINSTLKKKENIFKEEIKKENTIKTSNYNYTLNITSITFEGITHNVSIDEYGQKYVIIGKITGDGNNLIKVNYSGNVTPSNAYTSPNYYNNPDAIIKDNDYASKVKWNNDYTKVLNAPTLGFYTLKYGTAELYVCRENLYDGKHYDKSVEDSVTIIVEETPVTGINIKNENLTVEQNQTLPLGVSTEPWYATNNTIIYTSADESIATVDSKGNVKGINIGNTVITATNSNGDTVTCNITVTEAKITGIKLNKTTYICCSKKAPTGANTTLKATVTPSYAAYDKVIFTSSNNNIVSVNQNGKVTVKKCISKPNGTVTITATIIDKDGNTVKDKNGKVISAKYTIKREKVNKVTASKKSITLNKKGRTYNLKAYVYATKAKKTLATSSDVIWTSSNKKIATVDKNGKVTIRRKIAKKTKTKSVTITVKARDNTKKKATVKVITKYQPLKKMTTSRYIHFTNYTDFTKGCDLGTKKTINVKYNVTNPTNSGVKFKSSNSKVISVNSKGVITLKKKKYGIYYITVTTKSKYKGKKITKKIPVYVNGGKDGFVNGFKTNIILKEVNKRRKAKGYEPLVYSSNKKDWESIKAWMDRFYTWSIEYGNKMADKDVNNVHEEKWIDKKMDNGLFSEFEDSQLWSDSVGGAESIKVLKTQSNRDLYIEDIKNLMIIHDNKIVSKKNIRYFSMWVTFGTKNSWIDVRSCYE